ncbi:glycoside hydrolase family 6 protein [Amycolatopsis sp. H20-H5]|uniref:glycoside hydrolase family 6 protein n=1 Tax=Amycolatopsis sp. H20-H5 TaxID=3046309 RepID=UPI002DB6340E|nr:glycoside hydrolase family 6 protein [Amycolatopsis sp. H20-H5]MEC3982633.1 glycoside hydrolase family 6 protein [Amycolatopsis sp. H20-H5]
MRLLPGLAAWVALILVMTTVTSSTPTAESSPADVPNPLAGWPLYVDPASPAHQALVADPADPAAAALAAVPQARWFTDATPASEVREAVADYVDGSAGLSALPVLVVYAIPGRDCGGFSSGGLADAATYAGWIRQVRAGIGGHRAAVVVEPDALAGADCLGPVARTARYAMLTDVVTRLGLDRTTAVYLDAGHSRWLGAVELARRLDLAGIRHSRGFSLNVSNYFTTAEEQSYGEQVSALLGGAHYVVDASRNGLGPAPDAPLNWCNPQGRATGPVPSATTAAVHDDADLWIKNPGQSDGDCGRSDPRSGLWFPTQAAGLLGHAQR